MANLLSLQGQSIGIAANPKKKQIWSPMERTFEWLANNNCNVELEPDLFSAVKNRNFEILPNLKAVTLDKMNVDLLISMGGDGTILRASRVTGDTPILPINLGRKGFMAEIEPDNIIEALSDIKSQRCYFEFVDRLEISVLNRKLPTALNEYLITSPTPYRTIEGKIHISDQFLSSFMADGIIISTSTGSTGHSMSAGGPIVEPGLPTMIISWICPIECYLHPIVISNDHTITIEASSRDDQIRILTDGQISDEVLSPVSIIIKRSPTSQTKFIRLLGPFLRIGRKLR